jgi:hypothetical protein
VVPSLALEVEAGVEVVEVVIVVEAVEGTC